MVKKQNCVIWIPTYAQKTLDTFIAYMKTDDIYGGIAEGFETRFATSNYELERTLPK